MSSKCHQHCLPPRFFAYYYCLLNLTEHIHRSNVGSTQILDLAGDPEQETEMKSRVMSAMVRFGTLCVCVFMSSAVLALLSGGVCCSQSFHSPHSDFIVPLPVSDKNFVLNFSIELMNL